MLFHNYKSFNLVVNSSIEPIKLQSYIETLKTRPEVNLISSRFECFQIILIMEVVMFIPGTIVKHIVRFRVSQKG